MITSANLEDVLAIEQLINSAYRGETSKLGWTTEAHLLQGNRIEAQEIIELLQQQENSLLLYTKEGRIMGCVLLVNKTDQLYLGMLTVSPLDQNSGIGKELLKAAQKHALVLGLPKLSMTVISSREELIQWYKRHGFRDTGKREPFPLNGTDAIIGSEPLEFMVLEKLI